MVRWTTSLCAAAVLAGSALAAQDALPPLKPPLTFTTRRPARPLGCDSTGVPAPTYDSVRWLEPTDRPPRILHVGRVAGPKGLAGVAARVQLRFVLDTTGRAAPCSIAVVAGSDPRFIPAAAQALKSMTFVPAEADGHRVSRWMDQPFIWEDH